MCCSSATLVGGMLSNSLDFSQNSSWRASLTFNRLLVWTQRSTTNLFKTASDSSVMISGEAFKAHRTGVNSGKTFQTSHADFFPRLRKNETVWDPVKAWNIGNADTLEGPKDEATTCAGMCCTFFPKPYVIQNSSTGSVLTTERARTITSVSLVLILMRR